MSEVGHCHHSIPALRRVCILAYSLMNYHHVWRKKCIGKKPPVRYRHTFYFIDTEIYTLKYYRVLSFVSLIGQTMYFHRRSPPIFEFKIWKNLSLYEIKTSYHGKCLNDFTHQLRCIRKLTRLLRSLVGIFDASQLVNGIITIPYYKIHTMPVAMNL